jgi:hypothetical protein
MKCRECFEYCWIEQVKTINGLVEYGRCKHPTLDKEQFPSGMLVGRNLDIWPWNCPERKKDEREAG